MTNWYYYEDDGQRQGVYSDGQLKWLAKHGIVTPDTLVESDEGGVTQAKKVRGLLFMEITQKIPFWKAIDKQRLFGKKWRKTAIILAIMCGIFSYTGTWWILILCWLIWGIVLAVCLLPVIVVNAAQDVSDISTLIMSGQN